MKSYSGHLILLLFSNWFIGFSKIERLNVGFSIAVCWVIFELSSLLLLLSLLSSLLSSLLLSLWLSLSYHYHYYYCLDSCLKFCLSSGDRSVLCLLLVIWIVNRGRLFRLLLLSCLFLFCTMHLRLNFLCISYTLQNSQVLLI